MIVIRGVERKSWTESRIKEELENKFPGGRFSVTIDENNNWEITTLESSRTDFYNLYPGLSKEQADTQILIDTEDIVRKYINAYLKGYERDGTYHRIY